MSQVGCQPTQPGDTDPSTSDAGTTTADGTTGPGGTTGPDGTTGPTPTTGEATTAPGSTSDPTTGSDPSTTGGETTGGETTGGDPSTTGDETTGGAFDCTAPGSFHLVSPELGIAIHDDAAMIDVVDMKPAGIRGVADGQEYYFWRDGDIADGTLDPGSHDVSEYPFHVVLQVGPEGVDCEADPPQCQLIFGLAGSWEIASEQPFAGGLQATDLTADENCWDDGPPLDTSGCRLSKDQMQACFNVPWP